MNHDADTGFRFCTISCTQLARARLRRFQGHGAAIRMLSEFTIGICVSVCRPDDETIDSSIGPEKQAAKQLLFQTFIARNRELRTSLRLLLH